VPFEPHVPWLSEASPVRRYLVAVSGGADSTALLHLLVNAGFGNLVVCHLDHGLRGSESAEDAEFVAKLADELDLSSDIACDDVTAVANETASSLETAGREARHRFYADCARRHDCREVLLGHHADDRAETVLWNLLRGSYGAKGMRPRQPLGDLTLVRPLLGIRREELRRYLTERGLAWREDGSNAEPFAIRNRIRHEALPLLSSITGRDGVPALVRTAEAGEDQEEILAWALDRAEVLDPQGRLHLPALRELPPALQRAAVFRYLHRHGIVDLDRSLLQKAVALLDSQGETSSLNLPGGRYLRRRAGRLLIE